MKNETTSGHHWGLPGAPRRGWVCIDVYDAGTPSETCQMCGKDDIRYVHTMEHPDHADVLEVGCVCAEHMSDDYVNPKARERKLRNRAARRKTWLARK